MQIEVDDMESNDPFGAQVPTPTTVPGSDKLPGTTSGSEPLSNKLALSMDLDEQELNNNAKGIEVATNFLDNWLAS